jgi:hypothetical protein
VNNGFLGNSTGGESMNRKTLLIASVLIAVTFSMPFVTPASAAITYSEHISIMGEDIIIIIPDVTPSTGLRITFAHFDGGDHGVRDNMALYLYKGAPQNRWILTAWYSDTDEGYAYIHDLLAGGFQVTKQLKPNELQVRGTTNVIGRWTVPLVSPAVQALGFPEIIVPPGHVTLNQYGDVMTGTVAPVTFPSGFVFTVDWTGYKADGHAVIPEWNLNEQISGAKLNVDATQTAIHQ